MTETDDLTALRSAVAELEESQKLTFAAFLISKCNPNFGLKVKQEEVLEKAFTASEDFAVAEKLSFAIELLQSCQDEEEDDGFPDTADYDEENYPESTRINGAYRTPDGDEYEEGADDHYGVDVPGWDKEGGRTSAPDDFDIRTKWRFEDGV